MSLKFDLALIRRPLDLNDHIHATKLVLHLGWISHSWWCKCKNQIGPPLDLVTSHVANKVEGAKVIYGPRGSLALQLSFSPPQLSIELTCRNEL